MTDHTLTLALDGDEISLESFALALKHFEGLVTAVSDEASLAGGHWSISSLEVSSAIATVGFVAQNGYDSAAATAAVHAFLETGRALESNTASSLSPRVRKETSALLKVLDGEVEAVRFETPEAEAVVRRSDEFVTSPQSSDVARPAYGAVTGRIQTISSRSGLRFTLFDRLYNKAVGCYLDEKDSQLLSDVWDKLATVEGWVSRDAQSGRPTAVRRITAITVIDEGASTGYLAARGAVPRGPNGLRAEHRIRRLREAK